ncbi:MAG: SlyX family protein [Gammaproteobacteria bacterium]|nr:SlyX family protein [Gammaproteobacteria bacterium]
MSDTDLQARLEALEIRLAHHEAAMDELTRTLLQQERLVGEQAETIRRLAAQLRAATPSLIASRDEETPPPHY